MAGKFVLEYTATQIAEFDHAPYAEMWLRVAARYVVTLSIGKLELCSKTAKEGFENGWRILYDKKLTRKTMFEFLKDTKPFEGGFDETLPKAV